MTHLIRPLLLSLLLLMARGAFAQRLDTQIEKIIGEPVKLALRSASGVETDPLLANWIRGIGAEVSAPAPRRDVRYEFEILGTDTANAITTPGGTIFVTRGLLDSVSSDDELATVLAHESGHVAKRHAMQQIGANLIATLLISSLKGNRYGNVRIGATVLNLLITLNRSRANEAQADAVGIEYAYQSGYDPAGLVGFFDSLGASKESRLEQYFDTHPTVEQRIATARRSPLVAQTTSEVRETIAKGFERRGLPGAAAKERRGENPLALPAPIFPTMSNQVAAEEAAVSREADAARRALTGAYKADRLSGNLQSILLINNQLNDLRWIYLAARAYAVETNVSDVYSRTLRTLRLATPTYDALAVYTNRTPGTSAMINSSLGRAEVARAVRFARGAPTPLERASRAVAVVLVDLNNRFYHLKNSASWLRYGTLEGLLRYAESELARADRASGVAWRLLNLARVRQYEARLNDLIPETDTVHRALWFDLAQRRFGSAFPNAGQTGSATVRAALAIERGASATEIAQGRGDTPWADWILKREGAPENIATAMRLLTLDIEREMAPANPQVLSQR